MSGQVTVKKMVSEFDFENSGLAHYQAIKDALGEKFVESRNMEYRRLARIRAEIDRATTKLEELNPTTDAYAKLVNALDKMHGAEMRLQKANGLALSMTQAAAKKPPETRDDRQQHLPGMGLDLVG